MDAKTVAIIRKDVTRSLGSDIEDKKERAAEKVQRMGGAEQYVSSAAKAVGTLHARASQEVDAGTLSAEEYKQVKRYLTDAVQVLSEISAKAAQTLLEAAGELQAYTQTVLMLKKAHDKEDARIAYIEREELKAEEERKEDNEEELTGE